METLSALLALCEGKPPITEGFPKQRPVPGSFGVFFLFPPEQTVEETIEMPVFETPLPWLWRHCNANFLRYMSSLSHNVILILSLSRNKYLKFSNTPQYRMCETHLFKELSPKDTILVWCWNIMRRGLRYISKRHNRLQSVSIRVPRRYFPLPRIGDALQWRHMGAIASQITSLTIVYSIVYSDADQRQHQSSASLAFVRGIHWGPVNSPHNCPVTRKIFPFDDVIMGYIVTHQPTVSTSVYQCLVAHESVSDFSVVILGKGLSPIRHQASTCRIATLLSSGPHTAFDIEIPTSP